MITFLKAPIKLGLFSLLFLISSNNYASFLQDQLKYKRVRTAYHEKRPIILEKLTDMDFTLKNVKVLIKAYKYEQKVKIYVKSTDQTKWKLYEVFPFCYFSGELGPKRAEGDYQIPEGYYKVNHFNPYSNFYLSLGISYPNKSDKIKSSAKRKGGAIYMHGGCATIGCIPIKYEPIKELYILTVMAKDNGQNSIPIHILPFEYTEQKMSMAKQKFPQHENFWKNLFVVESYFDSTKIQLPVSIDNKGDYKLNR